MRPALEIASLPDDVRAHDSGHHFAVRLRCPVCKGCFSDERRCTSCNFLLKEKDGIVLALAPDRLAYYADFIADYERIRDAEGRGSRDKSYYLALPHLDTTGNNSGQWRIRARSYDYLVRRVLNSSADGESVLDLGAGNCWLSFHLSRRGYRPVAVDLLTNAQDGLGAAIHYNRELRSDIPRFQADLNRLPFQDEQFDVVIFNASFHYSEDYEITLREALRCTKPDGSVVVCDTPWYSRDENGRLMIAERRAYFLDRFCTASDSVESQEFLTDERLRSLEESLSIRWTVHSPWYGWRWAMRPWIARLRKRREPSKFRIYMARKDAVGPVDLTSDSAVTVINGIRYATGSDAAVRGSLRIVADKVQHLHSESTRLSASVSEMNLEGFLLLPGLINAHDHLQYALHPRLGHPPYNNYVEWGDDIHETLPSVISHYNSVPKDVRLWWGAIRNLLCGVTTVCHHDPLWPTLQAEGYPIKVLPNYGWAHSVRLASDIRQAWADTQNGCAFFIHACEGTDELARRELAELDELDMLNAKTVIVHGLALDELGVALLQERQASLILCLTSNQFLYGRLPDIKHLSAVEKIALGNDSPISAAGDLLDEVRFAIERASIPMETAYRMITDLPAAILRLANGEGHIRESGCADFIAIRDNGDPPHKRLLTLSWRDVEFVMIAGKVQLASENVWHLLPPAAREGMESLWIDGDIRWLRAPVRQLLQQAEAVLGTGMVRLGERVVQHTDSAISNSPVAYQEMPLLEERP